MSVQKMLAKVKRRLASGYESADAFDAITNDLDTLIKVVEISIEGLVDIKNARRDNPNQELGDLLLYVKAVADDHLNEGNSIAKDHT